MSKLFVARRKQRTGLLLPMEGTVKNPSLIFFLPEKNGKQVDPSYLDELIRSQLEKVGITKESDVQAIVKKAELDYEFKIKVEEAKREVRRLMELRKQGAKLVQRGYRKWKEAFYLSR